MIKKITDYLAEKYGQIGSIIVVVIALLIYILIPLHPTGLKFDSEKVIRFADNFSESHRILVEKFNKEHKGKIRVEVIDLPFRKFSTNERKELLTRALRSKSKRIDLFSVDQIWVSRFEKWCEPLNRYFSTKEREKFLENAIETCFLDNRLVAIPLYLDISVLYYRDDILRKYLGDETIEELKNSITWEKFLSLKSKIKQEPLYLFQGAAYEGLICSYYETILNQNPDYFNIYGPDFEHQEAKKGLQLLVDIVNKYKLAPDLVTDFKEEQSYKYFLHNDGVFLRGWPSFDSDNKNLIRDKNIENKLKKVPLPHFKGTKPVSVFGGWNLMVSKYSDKKKEVLTFIKFLVSEESQKILQEKGSYFPVIKSIYENNDYLNTHPDFAEKVKLLKYGIHRPKLRDYTRISDIVSYFVRKAVKKEISVDSALVEINKMIKSNKPLIK